MHTCMKINFETICEFYCCVCGQIPHKQNWTSKKNPIIMNKSRAHGEHVHLPLCHTTVCSSYSHVSVSLLTCLAVMLGESKWSALTSLLVSCSRPSTTDTYPSTSSSSVWVGRQCGGSSHLQRKTVAILFHNVHMLSLLFLCTHACSLCTHYGMYDG